MDILTCDSAVEALEAGIEPRVRVAVRNIASGFATPPLITTRDVEHNLPDRALEVRQRLFGERLERCLRVLEVRFLGRWVDDSWFRLPSPELLAGRFPVSERDGFGAELTSHVNHDRSHLKLKRGDERKTY